MNMIQSTIAATFVTVSFVTSAFSADSGKPVVPAPPVVASQSPAVDTAAKSKAANLRNRNKKAREATNLRNRNKKAREATRLRNRNKKAGEATGAVKKTDVKAVDPVFPAPTGAAGTPAAPAGAARKASRLNQRNLKARENTKASGAGAQ